MSDLKSTTTQETSNSGSSGYWKWIETAKGMATKAQEIAEVAGKVVVAKAVEIRENYDMDTATNILMTTIGATPTLDAAAEPQPTNPTTSKSNIKLNQLDLVYMTENLIGMAFPYDPKRPGNAEGGNDINAVSNFLRKKHSGHFMVWNVSEEPYNYGLFGDQVLEYKFPGHPAPPLGLLFKICTSVESWLDADERNVAIVHCLTGKGRTAALAACILTWIGEFTSPMEALQYVAERRAISVEYLTIPSQRRYVQYFSNMLDGVKPRSEPLLLRRVIINSIPHFGDNAGGEGNVGCCPYVQLFKCGRLVATAAPPTDTEPVMEANDSKNQRLQLKWIKATEGSVSFHVDCAVQGDILLRCRHADSSGARVSMFRAAFHTGYVPCGVLRLTKAQLDGACSDPRFSEDFFIDLIFAPIEKAPAPAPPTLSVPDSTSTGAPSLPSPATAVPTDSGLLIDSSSSDRYELTLHRDTRFWDAVAARKSKSKKRRSRKFISATQEQFSISDDAAGSGDSGEGEVTFTVKQPKPAGASGISDLELIMQLARAEGADDKEGSGGLSGPSSALSSKSTSSDTLAAAAANTANVELQALEELERELGLDDFQLFRSDASSTSSSASASSKAVVSDGSALGGGAAGDGGSGSGDDSGKGAAAGSGTDEDNLDELEQYLQSLSSNS